MLRQGQEREQGPDEGVGRKEVLLMGKVGMMELVIIGGLALLVFGPSQLPRLGKSLADTIRSFRQAGKELTGPLDEETRS